MRGLLIIASLGLSACVGQVGSLPADLVSYEWAATVQVTPDAPVAGRHVSLNVELTSHSNVTVVTDVVFRMVRDDGRVVHEEKWSQVKFHPEEVWNLTQGFVPATDDNGHLRVEVVVYEHETGAELWRNAEAAAVVLR